MAKKEESDRSEWFVRNGLAALLCMPVVYVLSSGPVLATAFCLRDRTDWDGFYAAMLIYYPLLFHSPLTYPFEVYIMWWVRLFGTMPPG